MNADMLLVRASPGEVGAALIDLAGQLEIEGKEPLPQPAFPSRPDIRRQRKRTLLLVKGAAGLTALLEGGEVADEILGRALSRKLGSEVTVIGLYESSNACARRRYANGVVQEEIFLPPDAFQNGVMDEGWDGDATSECTAWLNEIGWSHGLLLFSGMVRGQLPRDIVQGDVEKITFG
jgi:hypothetical protein